MKFKAKVWSGSRRVISCREWEGTSWLDVHNKVRAAYPEAARIEIDPPPGSSHGQMAIEHYDKLFPRDK